jgi:hypothetical protein
MLQFIGAAVAAGLATAAPSSDGSSGQFQAALNHAWKSTLADRHKGIMMSAQIKSGDAFSMRCSPSHLLENSRLSISIGSLLMPRNYSLVAIDEADRIVVIASTSRGGYIGDNVIQPALIRRGAVLTTEASTTYGHMDDSGYPYPAFGPVGRHLILLLDDAIVFGRRGIGARAGRIPGVVAGCVVSWNGLH